MSVRFSPFVAALGIMMFVPSALALRTSDAILREQTSMLEETDVCANEDRNRGQCITDTLKHLKSLRDEFSRALDAERTTWLNKNGTQSTATTEYRQALQEYLATVAEKRRLFNTQDRTIQKGFFDEQKAARSSAGSSSSSSSRTSTSMKAAQRACAGLKNSSAQRVCLRSQFRVGSLTEARKAALERRTLRSR